MNEVVSLSVPRPAQLPEDVPDSVLIEAVREHLFGAPDLEVALRLNVATQTLSAMTRTTAWRLLQNQFRDEFIATTGGRLIRMQQKLLDKLESYIDSGVPAHTQDGDEYMRQISPKEACGIAAMLDAENKRIDRFKEGDVDRKRFDAATMRRKLEGVVDGTAERVA